VSGIPEIFTRIEKNIHPERVKSSLVEEDAGLFGNALLDNEVAESAVRSVTPAMRGGGWLDEGLDDAKRNGGST
jgi:hypothetical protein